MRPLLKQLMLIGCIYIYIFYLFIDLSCKINIILDIKVCVLNTIYLKSTMGALKYSEW